MAWYDIPKFNVQYLANEQGAVQRVHLSRKDFDKLIETMEDMIDYEAVKEAQKPNVRIYTREEVERSIARKRRKKT